MQRVTKSRINAIENAGAYLLDSMDSFSELSEAEIKDHHKLGKLLIKNAEEVVKFLISKQSSKPEYTIGCKVCGEHFKSRESLYNHYDEEHN